MNVKSGTLFTRGKSKRYYLQYYINGRKMSVALKDMDGNPIVDRRKAEMAKADILNPLMAANNVDRLKKVMEAVETAEDRVKRIEAETEEKRIQTIENTINLKATLTEGWNIFMLCPKRPTSCKRYKNGNIQRHTSQWNYMGYYNTFVKWLREYYSGITLLSEVTPECASEFIDALSGDRASGTCNKYLQFLKMFYNVLLKSGKLKSGNPFEGIDRIEHRYNSKKPLTPEQIALLIDNAEGELKLLFTLGYFTGLRLGDCCTLLWSEINMERGIVERIPRKTAHRVKDQTQASVKIGIASKLMELLREVPLNERSGYVLSNTAKNYLDKKADAVSKRIKRHFEKCGISIHKAGTGVGGVRAVVEYGFHSLRYSYISHNAEAGVPAAVIQKNAGHSNPAMTEHYTKISDEAAVKYASMLKLGERKNDPERDELKKIIDTLPFEQVKTLLASLKCDNPVQ